MARIDGLQQRSFTIDEQSEITGLVQGSVSITQGVELTVTGVIQGSVNVSPDATVEIGSQGRLQGSLHVAVNGLVSVRGQLAGSVHNDGHLIFRSGATQAGPLYGRGTVDMEPNVHVVQPDIGPDGSHHYNL